MRDLRNTLVATAATVAIVTTVAAPPTAGAQSPPPSVFGTSGVVYHYLAAEDFFPSDGSDTEFYNHRGYGFRANYDTENASYFRSNLQLPSGALIIGYTVLFEDTEDDPVIVVALNREWVDTLAGTKDSVPLGIVTSVGSPGISSLWEPVNHTVAYHDPATSVYVSYTFELYLPPTTAVAFKGVLVHWKRQVSAPPATATFADVPVDHWAFQFVEALAASGITAGCGGGNYCPDNPITRAEMAVYLAAALGLHWTD